MNRAERAAAHLNAASISGRQLAEISETARGFAGPVRGDGRQIFSVRCML